MSLEQDIDLLERWLRLIDRLRERGALTLEEADALRATALRAIM